MFEAKIKIAQHHAQAIAHRLMDNLGNQESRLDLAKKELVIVVYHHKIKFSWCNHTEKIELRIVDITFAGWCPQLIETFEDIWPPGHVPIRLEHGRPITVGVGEGDHLLLPDCTPGELVGKLMTALAVIHGHQADESAAA